MSEYLRRTQAGEEITVCSRGQPVGRLLPSRAASPPSDEQALARLNALPGIRRGNGQRVRGSGQPVTVSPGTSEQLVDWVRGNNQGHSGTRAFMG